MAEKEPDRERADEPEKERQRARKERVVDKDTDPRPKKDGDGDEPAEAGEGEADRSDEVDAPSIDVIDRGVRIAQAAGTMYVNNNYGEGSRRERPSTGTVGPDELRAELQFFVDPPHLADALRCLVRHRVVVLAGPEGSGRRAAALALLNTIPDGTHEGRAPLVYSPSTTIHMLSEQEFVPGSRVLLADHTADRARMAERIFDLGNLRRRLEGSESALVVTTTTADGHLEDYLVRWQPVTGRAVLDHRLDHTQHGLSDADVERLREAVDGLGPGDARRLVERCEREGIEAALAGTAQQARARVATWFADATPAGHDGPPVRALLPLLAAAFLPGSTRSQHELAASLLHVHVDEEARRDPVVQDEDRERLDPSRSRWPDLLCLRPSDDPFGEPAIALRSPEDHEAILGELDLRYGGALWQAVEAWQRALPDAPEIDAESCLALAAGMAAFARIDASLVRRVLDVWAGGLVDARWTAAYTLHWMARDERTARRALLIADSWCSDATQRRAVTAAWAFDLDLAVPYPKEAVAHLWQLSLRGNPVAGWASVSLGVHVGNTAGSPDRRALPRALKNIARQVERVLSTRAHDRRTVQRALDALLAVLRGPAAGGSTSLTSFVLRERPDLVPRIAELWVHVLGGFAQRGQALEHLRKVFREIEKRPSAETARAVAALGEAVRARVDDEQWMWLCQDLPEGRW